MWIYENDNELLYFISEDFTYDESVIISSFSHTLINDDIKKEKIPFMKLYNDSTQAFLNDVNEQGSIIIVEHALFMSVEVLKQSVGQFFSLLDKKLPFMIFFILRNNMFKKPYTNIFKKIQELYKVSPNSTSVDLESSIVIGNNAGRLASNNYKKDMSDCDRAFAHNIGIPTFRTPNQVFADTTMRQWKWNMNIEPILEKQKSIVEPLFANVLEYDNKISTEKLIVFISGPPTSGKSLMGNRVKGFIGNAKIFDDNNFVVNSMHVALDNELPSIIEEKMHIIIINTFESNALRHKYFTILENHNIENYRIKYIEMDTTRVLCEFLNVFRLQITKSPALKLHTKKMYSDYYAYYIPITSQKISNKILHTLKYIKFPLVIRKRDEIFYHY